MIRKTNDDVTSKTIIVTEHAHYVGLQQYM